MDDLKQTTLEAKSNRSIPTGEDLSRLAELVASGEFQFPDQLSAEQCDWLASRVLKLRRQRFLRFLARSLAQSIYDDVQFKDRKVKSHVAESI